MGDVRSWLGEVGQAILGRAAGVAGKAGRKLVGMPLHVAVPVGIAFGVAVLVIAAKGRSSRRDPPPESTGSVV